MVIPSPTIYAHPVYSRLLPRALPHQDVALERSIRAHGVLLSVVTLPDGALLDGHRRWRIATRLKRTVPRIVLDLPSERAAVQWVLETHMLTRRFTDMHLRYYRGAIYELEEMKHGRRPLRRYKLATAQPLMTRYAVWRKLKAELGIRRGALELSAYWKEAMDHLIPDFRHEIGNRPRAIPFHAIYALSCMLEPEQKEIWEAWKSSGIPVHVLLEERQIISTVPRKIRVKIGDTLRLLRTLRKTMPAKLRTEVSPYLDAIALNVQRQTVDEKLS